MLSTLVVIGLAFYLAGIFEFMPAVLTGGLKWYMALIFLITWPVSVPAAFIWGK